MDSRSSKYEALFRDSSVWHSIFSLALPSLLTIVVMIFYNMADLFFIAQLRDTAKVAADMGAALIAALIFVREYRRVKEELS